MQNPTQEYILMKTSQSSHSTHATIHESGSTLVVGMVTLAVLALIAAATFQTVTNRFRSNYQTASWHDALTSAENGVQYGLARLRSPLMVTGVLTNPLKVPGSLQSDLATLSGSGGTSINGTVLSGTYGGSTYPRIQLPTLTIPHTGQGSSQFRAVTTIDAVPSNNLTYSGINTWYRIQSVGTVPMTGGAKVGIQKYDNFLRKLQFRYDAQGNSLATPQAQRTIEILAQPITTGSAALFGQTGINLNNQNVVIDSYDSRSSATSTYGIYDASKRTKAANIVTDDDPQSSGTPGVINLSPTGAYIYGNVSTNDTPVVGSTSHVSGTITQDFYQSLPDPPDPSAVTSSSSWTATDGSTNLTGGTQSAPAYYKINGSGDLSLTGNSSLALNALTDSSGNPIETYIQLWIPGSLKTTGNAQITVSAHVHATIYVDGSIQLAGNGIANPSLVPANLTLYGNHMDPSATGYTQQSMTFNGNAEFAGVIYAPDAAVTVKGGGSSGEMVGAIYADTIFFNGQTTLHYDQALSDAGAVIDYRIAAWFEDNTLTRQ
jgi:hypothetical protein